MLSESLIGKNDNSNNTLFAFRRFFNGRLYPLILIISILISHTFSIEEFGISIVLISAFLGLIICDDLKFLISPLIGFIFIFSEKRVSNGIFYKKGYIITMVICACILFALLIAHFIIYRKNIDLKKYKSSKLFLGFVLLSASFLLNGCLNFSEYKPGNIFYALTLILSISGIFFLFTINVNKSKDLVNYLMYVLFLISVLVTLEFFLSFINQIQFDNGQIIKETVKIGWGMWNNIGGILAFLLPVHFYFASSIKKIGFIFYFTGIVSFIAIVLTLSRSSLLSASITIVICIIISCFKGENKLINRILSIILAVLSLVVILVLWRKISSILGDYIARGLNDNGRFEMYKHGLSNFLKNPIFGGGFYSSYETEHRFIDFLPYRYHNTFIQMIATTGIIGILAYAFHRYQTIRLLIAKKHFSTIFIALSIGTMLCGSLLDNHFFNIYPAFIYSIMLMTLENTIYE